MRRWNGWGDEAVSYPLPESASQYIASQVGPGQSIPDATLEQVIASVPASRLPDHPLWVKDPLPRLLHARGQSLPDWIALRSGRIGVFPDGVAYPENDQQVRDLLSVAGQTGIRVIPYGGGTSVVGHINPLPGTAPVLTIDLSRMDQLERLEQGNCLAVFGAGMRGPELERQLNAQGYTLGHFPQSFEQSTLGGWIATRSNGQQSYYYGRIEDLFAGGHLETPLGPLDLPPLPASAAGPDLRQLVLGSEGRLGVITRAALRIRPLPQTEAFFGVFFRDWESGLAALRDVAQSRIPISMARLSDSTETETTLTLSGKDQLVSLGQLGLNLLGYGDQACLLIFGVTGDMQTAGWARHEAHSMLQVNQGLETGQWIGKMWEKSRFLTPYLRNTLWERGYALDTFETALPWSAVPEAGNAIKKALSACLPGSGEQPGAGLLVFSHISSIYPDGASIYVTCIFQRSPDPDQTLERWQSLKAAASQAILAHGGTISHQHGVGYDHLPYLETEKGALGTALLAAAFKASDPQGLLNPGKLINGPADPGK